MEDHGRGVYPSVKIKVSIPVKVGGYTGQRDAWEEFERDFVVRGDFSEVVLEDEHGSVKRKITFSLNDLQAALRALGLQQGPVMR